MDYTVIIAAIIGLFSGGGILAAISNLRKTRTEYLVIVLEEYKARVEKLEEKVEAQARKLAETEKANNTLLMIAAFGSQLPFPFWIKYPDGKMMYFNEAYADAFDANPDEYYGKTDEEYWGEHGKKYRYGDLKGMEQEGKVWIGREPIVIHGVDISEEWFVAKYGVWVGGEFGKRLCVANPGLAFPYLEKAAS